MVLHEMPHDAAPDAQMDAAAADAWPPDAAHAMDGALPPPDAYDLDAGPCVPVMYDFLADGDSGPSQALLRATLSSPGGLLSWSTAGYGATPGTIALDDGESLVIAWDGPSVGDIELAWSEPGAMRVDFLRWDGTRGPARIPANPGLTLVGPLRVITLTALAGAEEQHLVSLGYCQGL
jgi:hypothetical protein